MNAAPIRSNSFFSAGLAAADPEIARAIELELGRQRDEIELIASENIVSKAVLEAQGSVMTNKYAEGYPGRRYYGGCQFVDIAETLAIQRACKLFDCKFANVQPNSGSQANQAVFLALMQPGDTFMGLDLAAGGHLTHGSPVNMSGKWFKCVSYGVDRDDAPHRHGRGRRSSPASTSRSSSSPAARPTPGSGISLASARSPTRSAPISSATSRISPGWWRAARTLRRSRTPMSSTTTTHKTLRGPRGGMVMTNDEDIAKKINSAVFPGMQGGPLMHVIAAKAVAFHEALTPEFNAYAKAVVANAQALAEEILAGGYKLVTGGTDNHLMLVDLTPKKLTGKAAEAALGRAHITCNKNGIPFDPEKPMVTSGVRLGSPAATSRGFGVAEFTRVGELIVETLDGLAANGELGNAAVGSPRARGRRRTDAPLPHLLTGRAARERNPCAVPIAAVSTPR